MIRIGTPGFISAVSFDDLVFLSASHTRADAGLGPAPLDLFFSVIFRRRGSFVFCRNFRQTVVY